MIRFDRRRFLSAGAAGLAATTGLGAGLGIGPAEAAREIRLPTDLMAGRGPTIQAVQTSRPIVAMTYDDGPHPRLTPLLLDMLRARKMRATFYLIGKSVVTWPDVVKRIADEGHEIGNHTWSHPNLAAHGDARVLSEIDRTSEAIYRITGRPPVTFRPPYGSFTQRQREMLLRERGLPTVMWSVDTLDWRRPGSSVITSRIIRQSRPGSIVLSHDIHAPTVRAMPASFDGLLERGMKFGSLSEMMGWPLWQIRKFRKIGPRISPTGTPDLIALQ